MRYPLMVGDLVQIHRDCPQKVWHGIEGIVIRIEEPNAHNAWPGVILNIPKGWDKRPYPSIYFQQRHLHLMRRVVEKPLQHYLIDYFGETCISWISYDEQNNVVARGINTRDYFYEHMKPQSPCIK